MRLKLIRLAQDKNRTQKLGKLYLFDRYEEVFSCMTLEPYDCIKAGHYELKKYQSPKLKREVLLFKYVEGKSFVEIHNGNYLKNTNGCILTGQTVTDIDKDGKRDITNSVVTLDKLLSLCPNEIEIDIFENPSEFNL